MLPKTESDSEDDGPWEFMEDIIHGNSASRPTGVSPVPSPQPPPQPDGQSSPLSFAELEDTGYEFLEASSNEPSSGVTTLFGLTGVLQHHSGGQQVDELFFIPHRETPAPEPIDMKMLNRPVRGRVRGRA